MEICNKRYKRKVIKLKYKRLDNNRINTVRYKNNFAQMESDCVFKVGFSSFMKSIS